MYNNIVVQEFFAPAMIPARLPSIRTVTRNRGNGTKSIKKSALAVGCNKSRGKI